MSGSSPLRTFDVAHPPRRPDDVENDLMDEITRVRNSPSLRILKVIHGYGRSGKGGTTKEVVRNWAFLHRAHLRGVVNGEDYSLYAEETRRMRLEVGEYTDEDLGALNQGITLLWVK